MKRPVSPETRARMAEAQRARWASDPTLRERVAEKLRGRPMTPRQQAVLEEQHRHAGRPHSAEARAKISAALRRRNAEAPLSAETRARLGEMMRARLAAGIIDNTGKPRPAETRAKISVKRRATVARQRKAQAEQAEFARGIARAEAARHALLERMRG